MIIFLFPKFRFLIRALKIIYLFLAVLALWCSVGYSLRCGAWAFSCCEVQALGVQASVVALELGSVVALLFCVMWDLLGSGIEPVSPVFTKDSVSSLCLKSKSCHIGPQGASWVPDLPGPCSTSFGLVSSQIIIWLSDWLIHTQSCGTGTPTLKLPSKSQGRGFLAFWFGKGPQNSKWALACFCRRV